MSTLAIMKARIADELARDDLTSQIAYAVNDAIVAYQKDRYLFNESRSLTFSTVAGQEIYTSSEVAGLPLMFVIDQVTLTDGAAVWEMDRRRPEDLEISSQGATISGQPTSFSLYAGELRLYPVPDGVYTMRIIGQGTAAAPTNDAETGNPWMIAGERLIRSRAKLEIYAHVVQDDARASVMLQAVAEARDELKAQFNALSGTGMIQPTDF